jgi:hypothetical protein
MGQFGGAPRHDDYDFFTAPARPAATNGFGSGPATGGQFGGPPAPRHAPSARPPGARRTGRSGVLLPLLVAAVLVMSVAGVAAAQGVLPGLGDRATAPPAAAPPATSPYSVKPPKKLSGLTLSNGSKAKQIDAAFRSGGGFADHPVTTFVYVDGHHVVRLYGGVVLARMTTQDQRAFMAGATSSLSSDGQGISVSKLSPVRAGKLGGTMRCARLGTVPVSTECVFADRGSAGVIVVVGHSGSAGVATARATREAVVHRR